MRVNHVIDLPEIQTLSRARGMEIETAILIRSQRVAKLLVCRLYFEMLIYTSWGSFFKTNYLG